MKRVRTERARGHTIAEHWQYLFDHNEQAWLNNDLDAIMTDEEITLDMLAAFPGRRDHQILRNVVRVRARYNRGQLHCQKETGKPYRPSFRYIRLWPNGPVARVTARGRELERKGGI